MCNKITNILLIENVILTRETIYNLFNNENYNIFECDNYKTAIEIIEKHKFDVIIANLSISNNEGIEFLEKTQKINKNLLTNVIATAIGTQLNEIITLSLNMGVYSFLTKPFTINILKKHVYNIINSRQTIDPKIESKIVSIFSESSCKVMLNFVHLKLTPGRLYLKSGNKAELEYSAIIKLANKYVSGTMIVNMPEELLKKSEKNIFPSHLVSGLPKALKDICSEIANQILGAAKAMMLDEEQILFEMNVPSVIYEENHVYDYALNDKISVMPFWCDNIIMYVEFCLRRNTTENKSEIERSTETVAVKEGELLLF